MCTSIKIVPVLFSALIVCAGFFSGCATSAKSADAASTGPAPKFPRVSLVQDINSLGQTVRTVGEQAGGGCVVMNGLEDRLLPALRLTKVPYEQYVSQLAKDVECIYQRTPAYYFIYPQGYEVLTSLTLEGKLSPKYSNQSAAMAFGSNTELFNALAVISRNMGLTILADNALGDARVGELIVPQAPLQAGLEAILKSARSAPDSLVVDCTDEYLFLYTAANRSPKDTLINGAELTPEEQTALDRLVSATVPRMKTGGSEAAFMHTAIPLKEVLGDLSSQIGVTVTAEDSLMDLPVNYCVMNNVRVRTAMDLLIRQWLVPHFGYEFRDGQIRIRQQ
jgi:hypothetical protein